MTDSPRFESDDAVHDRILTEVPGLRAQWDASEAKRQVALFLVAMRSRAGLGQTDVARRAGWDKAFVSRLEAGLGGMPGLETLSRYAAVCEQEIGLVASARSDRSTVHIDAAMTLYSAASADEAPVFARLAGQDLDVAESADAPALPGRCAA